VKRGDIWLVNLDPTVGGGIRKTRPCVLVSSPKLHDHLFAERGVQAPPRACRRRAEEV
jgi:mRNA interferase MazF